MEFYGITAFHEPLQGLFLVFGLASGGTVREYLEQDGTNLQWDDVIDLFSGIATGLAELHQRGIAHGLAFVYILRSNKLQRPS